jgi:DNA-binding MarR family transcriptional regulator
VTDIGTAPSALTREQATRDLLSCLMSVKAWIRDTNRWLYANHSPASLFALALLDRNGPSRVSDLAEVARVDASVVSRQVSTLEQQGYVARTPDPADGRAHRLSLTPAGAKVLEDGRERLVGVVTERLDDWSADDIATFSARLQTLLVTIND